jgi:hypothetical protein
LNEQHVPSCEVRRQLAEAFAKAARQYSDSAVLLATLVVSETDYFHLRRLTLEAKNRSEAAFASYVQHVDLHRCVIGAKGSSGRSIRANA